MIRCPTVPPLATISFAPRSSRSLFCTSFFRECRERAQLRTYSMTITDLRERERDRPDLAKVTVGCWRVKNESDKNLIGLPLEVKVRLTKGVARACRVFVDPPSSLLVSPVYLSFSPNPYRSAESGGQDGIMSATSQGSRQGRTLSSRATSSRCRSPPARNHQRH